MNLTTKQEQLIKGLMSMCCDSLCGSGPVDMQTFVSNLKTFADALNDKEKS